MTGSFVEIDTLTACPQCGDKALTDHGAPEQWIGAEFFAHLRGRLSVQSCGRCGLEFISPRPTREQLVEFYQDPSYDCHSESYAADDAADAVVRLGLMETITGKGKLLDFGCGAGALLSAAAGRGWDRAVGVELGANARSRLRSRGIEVHADLAEAVQHTGRPSVVSMIHVLEHLVDPAAELQAVHAALETGGFIVVEVPNIGSLRARLAGSAVNSWFPAPGQRYQAFPIHLYYFCTSTLRNLLVDTGYDPIATYTLGIGVDELLRNASIPYADRKPDTLASVGPAMTQPPESDRPVRRFVKKVLSDLRLGEHLLVIARKR